MCQVRLDAQLSSPQPGRGRQDRPQQKDAGIQKWRTKLDRVIFYRISPNQFLYLVNNRKNLVYSFEYFLTTKRKYQNIVNYWVGRQPPYCIGQQPAIPIVLLDAIASVGLHRFLTDEHSTCKMVISYVSLFDM